MALLYFTYYILHYYIDVIAASRRPENGGISYFHFIFSIRLVSYISYFGWWRWCLHDIDVESFISNNDLVGWYHCCPSKTDAADQFMSLLGSISPRLEGQRPNSRGHATQSQWSGPTSCEPISISAPASLWQTSKHRHCQWSGDSGYLWPPLTSNPLKGSRSNHLARFLFLAIA